MRNSVYPIDLITVTTGKDELNQVVENNRTTASVFAEISSVTQTEFFEGGRLGLQPSLKATIYDFEYNDEPIVKVHFTDTKAKLYSVYRAYFVNGSDKVELYLEERGGTKDEPSADDSSSEHSD